jgi:hypothetical protein
MLQTDGATGMVNDIWLSIDGTNYEDADIHIVGARIDVKKKNTIKTTPLVSRAGEVKERIQENDYIVKISGNLTADQLGKFPYELLKQLNEILTLRRVFMLRANFLIFLRFQCWYLIMQTSIRVD